MGTIVIGAVVLGVVFFAAAQVYKDKKAGKPTGCAGCTGCSTGAGCGSVSPELKK